MVRRRCEHAVTGGGPAEGGTGLVELLMAAGLAVLGLSVLAALVRGPVATAVARTSPSPAVEGMALARQLVGGVVRAAEDDAEGPAVAVAGPSRIVLRTGSGPDRWTALIADGSVLRIQEGAGSPSEASVGDGPAIGLPGGAALAVLDATGRELAGPVAGTRGLDDPFLAAAVLVELHVEVADGPPRRMSFSLRGVP